jgi:acyl dehydratase
VSISAATLNVGDSKELQLVDDLTRTQIVMYAGASGDYNPLHSDEKFAREVAGYPGIFAHGMLTMGMPGRALTDLVGDGRLLSFGGRFTAQVWPGDDLSSTMKVESVRDVDGEKVVDLTVSTSNQDGVVVFSGQATARLDS